ncbi:DUF6266 family protein [Aestuariibaculum lutulentum]|uniref:DUF6266 family protein n=1 Tax=Aestuariibaculum lutulentum TaxID=2920935 RepID=A0ABS9RMB3_9FLAO|nr:DUF6266 family protein [Aestuariibaculum lutulentum]MCH4554095.1 DUF6266 family protein [Aestuariibaculum lutulentum]
MATYQQGVLGDFSGKVGTVIGSRWRGKAVLRSLPNKSQKPPTPAQQLQRNRFKCIHSFLTPIKDLLNETFGAPVKSKSRYNLAFSYHLKEATIFNGVDFEIQYNKVLLSMGPLRGLESPLVTHPETGHLHLQWADNSNQGMAYHDDELLVVAYAPALKLFSCFTHMARRTDGECLLDFEPVFHGLEVELWAGFTNSNKQLSATSMYLGNYTVQ